MADFEGNIKTRSYLISYLELMGQSKQQIEQIFKKAKNFLSPTFAFVDLQHAPLVEVQQFASWIKQQAINNLIKICDSNCLNQEISEKINNICKDIEENKIQKSEQLKLNYKSLEELLKQGMGELVKMENYPILKRYK